ncbi:hypothetical protein K503DRAFT_783899 [Rhizopogon vinicolor AM-OR11-026]|uniref:Uncharacterized protein n=1 Tax=Rhizopogon vinicolor AM-OR11-026 TaxID=1314800 RepID=A0A1B7MWX0_9AGAM|nr:hypothetical protein K503DRAFT_783899 [Rhizopogon vinicolor AM-OR11-026]
MSNLPKCPLPLTEQVTAKKAFQIIGAGIILVTQAICQLYRLPQTWGKAGLFCRHILFWIFLVVSSTGGRGTETGHKQKLDVQKANEGAKNIFCVRNSNYSIAVLGAYNTCNGLGFVFQPRRKVDFSVWLYILGLLTLRAAVYQIYIAYVGRVPTKDNNKTVDNNDSQPASEEVTTGNVNNDVLSKVFMI